MRTVICLILLIALSSCSRDPQVTVAGERLVGFKHPQTGVAAFLGVPFAEPPLGELRWAAPQALRTKQATRQATQFAAACMQSMRILDWYQDLAETFGASRDDYDPLNVDEDCLYLNIWTPNVSRDAALPVMVYVHGGSNNSGWSYEVPYHGHRLAEEGVVVVTVGYRVGLFGFFSHPELTGDAVANFGLWDQVAALNWIQHNIARFGGDPDRVMAFGESAGAEDVLALLFAKPANGLIHRVALHSNAGFGLSQPTLFDERERGRLFADHLRLPALGSLAALRMMPADRLLATYDTLFSDYYHSPAVDGQLLTESTWDSINRLVAPGVPIIIGTNADEWRESVDQHPDADSVVTLANNLRNIDADAALAAIASEEDLTRALDRLRTADKMLCPSQFAAARWNTNGSNAWNYYFTRVRDGEAGRNVGAFHGAEYTYVFGTNYAGMPVTEIDVALEREMMSYWVRFAETGDPNGAGLPLWPVFTSPDYRAQELGDKVTTIARPEELLCKAFDRHHTAPNAQADKSFSNQATSQ